MPDKLLALKSPIDLPDRMLWRDPTQGDFSPMHYAQALRDLDVSMAVLLSQPLYATPRRRVLSAPPASR